MGERALGQAHSHELDSVPGAASVDAESAAVASLRAESVGVAGGSAEPAGVAAGAGEPAGVAQSGEFDGGVRAGTGRLDGPGLGAAGVEEPTAEVRELFGLAFAGAEHFAQMLADEGELRGLVGPRELPRLWTRHIVNSAAVVPFLPARGTVADVGSGAGFPGIVAALMRPDLEFTLIETMERRVEWLELVVDELGLDNVTVLRARAEEVTDRYDAVTARAVANLSKLVRLTSRLLRQGGCLLALKGEKAQAEVEDAKYVIKKAKLLPATVHEVITPGDDVTRVVEIRRPRR